MRGDRTRKPRPRATPRLQRPPARRLRRYPVTSPSRRAERLHGKIRRLAAEGVRPTEVARRCGCSRPLVNYVLKRARTRRDRMLSQGLRMLGEQRAGRTLAEIADLDRVSMSTVLKRLKLAKAHEAKHLEGPTP